MANIKDSLCICARVCDDKVDISRRWPLLSVIRSHKSRSSNAQTGMGSARRITKGAKRFRVTDRSLVEC